MPYQTPCGNGFIDFKEDFKEAKKELNSFKKIKNALFFLAIIAAGLLLVNAILAAILNNLGPAPWSN